MSFIAKGIDDIFGSDLSGGKEAAKSTRDAANTAAQSQREALDYVKETEALPQQFREQGLQGLAGLLGLEGGTGSQQQLIDQAKSSPLYASIMGAQEQGEEAILRNASATGGLRSGNTSGELYDYNTQLQNDALLNSYNQQLQGLQGLAGIASNSGQIGNMISGIGQTQAQGIAGAAQAKQQGYRDLGSEIGQGLQAGANFFSDRRLKENMRYEGTENGHKVYSWDWNQMAQNGLGLHGRAFGVIADEVEKIDPDAVSISNGFKTVNYEKIGVNHGAR